MRAASRVALVSAVVLVAVALPGAVPGSARTGAIPAAATAAAVPGERLPLVRAHRYRMAGRIRPLLFWIGRDDVGLARIAWRRGDDGTVGYELLVGTDPARAPRAVNRWGYVAEDALGRDGATLALMSRSDETSLGEVQTHLDPGTTGGEFRALVASLEGGVARWQVASVRTAGRPTVHDLPDLLGQVHAQAASAAVRSASRASDVRPGFLGAVAELVDRTVAASRAGSTARLTDAVVPYAFGQGLYELRQSSLRVVQAPPGSPASGGRVAEAAFEIRTLSTAARTRFEMTYGLSGQLAGVPLEIAWQPRWWLKVELHLDDR